MKKNVVITADEDLLGLLYATIEGINEAEGFGRKILHGDKTKHIDRAIREYVEKYGGEQSRWSPEKRSGVAVIEDEI